MRGPPLFVCVAIGPAAPAAGMSDRGDETPSACHVAYGRCADDPARGGCLASVRRSGSGRWSADRGRGSRIAGPAPRGRRGGDPRRHPRRRHAADSGAIHPAAPATLRRVDSQHGRSPPVEALAAFRPGSETRVAKTLEFGVNLNNREPLIAPGYGHARSCWTCRRPWRASASTPCGSATACSPSRATSRWRCCRRSRQRTRRVKLGTACIVTSPRNPLYLALEWATLDVLSDGRTIFGPCAGNPEAGRPPRVRGARPGLRQALLASSRKASRSCASCGSTARSRFKGPVRLPVRRSSLLLGHGDGAADAHPAAAPVLDRVQPAPRDQRRGREDGAHDEDRLPADPQVRRRLDDLLPRAAPRGARGAAGLPARGRRGDRRRREPAASSATR